MNQKDRKEHFASFDQTVWMGERRAVEAIAREVRVVSAV